MTSTNFWRVLFVIFFIIVTYASLTPDPDTLDQSGGIMKWLASLLLGSEDHGDKIAHFLAYGALGFCIFPGRLALFGRFALTFVALLGYGFLMEWMQSFSVERQTSMLDATANTAGLIAGLGAGYLFLNLFKRRS